MLLLQGADDNAENACKTSHEGALTQPSTLPAKKRGVSSVPDRLLTLPAAGYMHAARCMHEDCFPCSSTDSHGQGHPTFHTRMLMTGFNQMQLTMVKKGGNNAKPPAGPGLPTDEAQLEAPKKAIPPRIVPQDNDTTAVPSESEAGSHNKAEKQQVRVSST